MARGLNRTVLLLGWVSFFNDAASEMIYPLLPVFLATVLGAGPVALGLMEGVAEAVAAALKLAAGWWADRVARRKPFLLAGYGLSGFLRPLMGLAGAWPVVAGLRFADRLGKGLRSAPRDALLTQATPRAHLGAAFGFHRAMDHAGAVAGPLLAAALMQGLGFSLRQVFLAAAVPAVVVVALIALGVKEAPGPNPDADDGAEKPPALQTRLESTKDAAAPSARDKKRFALVLVAMWVFTLGNATDAFILLRLTQAGAGAAGVAVLWSAFHVVKMIANFAGGRLSDRFGPTPMLLAGWLLYAACYAAFGLREGLWWTLAVFLVYGLHYGLVEPAEKALVAQLAPVARRGAAFGAYHATLGLGALPASLLFGLLWKHVGPAAAFFVGAALSALAAGVLVVASNGPLPEGEGGSWP